MCLKYERVKEQDGSIYNMVGFRNSVLNFINNQMRFERLKVLIIKKKLLDYTDNFISKVEHLNFTIMYPNLDLKLQAVVVLKFNCG